MVDLDSAMRNAPPETIRLRVELEELVHTLKSMAGDECRICHGPMHLDGSSPEFHGLKYSCERAAQEWKDQHYQGMPPTHWVQSFTIVRDDYDKGLRFAAVQLDGILKRMSGSSHNLTSRTDLT